MIEKAVYARLTGFAGLAALVADRVYRLPLPEDVVYPAVGFVRISTTRPSAMGSDVGKARARVQIDAWADDLLEALTVVDQIRAALQRWSGAAGGVTVRASFLVNQLTRYEDEVELHRVILDFEMWYDE